MQELKTVQKIFAVFQRLSWLAMIVSWVAMGAAILGIVVICVLKTDMNWGWLGTENHFEIINLLLSDAILAFADGFLFGYAWHYFRTEQRAGTPFTHQGAQQLRCLGILTIVLPLAAFVIAAIVSEYFQLPRDLDWSNGSTVVLGILCILFSYVLHYGAQLEQEA